MDNQINQLQTQNSNQLQTLENKPDQLLQTINPKTVADIITSTNPSIVKLIKLNGEPVIKACFVDLIAEVVEFFSLGKTMSGQQIASTVDLIIEAYPQYKFDDWKLCFKMAKLGQLGKVYDRIDGNVIFDWFDKYLEIRFAEFETARAKENRILNEPIKADPTPMPDYVKELITKKVITKEPEKQLNQTDRQKVINDWLKEFDFIWMEQGAPDGKRFIMFQDIKMDQAEFLQHKIQNDYL